MKRLNAIDANPMVGGYLGTVDFPNGYGASVVRSSFSYGGNEGLYELAVIKNEEICYDSGVTEDVIGYLDETEVCKLLDEIQDL